MKLLPLLVALLLTASAQAQTHVIGRLFFTPEERHQLDVGRGLIAAPPPPPAPVEAAAPPPPPPPLTVNGFIRRSNGPATVWVNRNATPASVAGPQVTLTLPSGQQVRIKPGQTVDMGTGAIRDVNQR